VKVFEHQKYSKIYPHHDQINHNWDWSKFSDDPRTQNIDVHIGSSIDFSKIRDDKISVNINGEYPNSWFGGSRRGQCIPHNINVEKLFDYIFCQCKQTSHARGYPFVPYAYDFTHILSKIGFNDIDDVKKDIDVFMCATCPGEYWEGERHPVWSWYKIMEKFNHSFCNRDWPSHNVSWEKMQESQARSKITIVFSDFIGSTPMCREFAKENFPWIKFKNNDGMKPVTPQPKPRILNAASTKSLILCHRGPFVGEAPPYNSAIEDYLDPSTDFIYFDDDDDLERKLHLILDDYENPKYKKMIESAYDKMINNFDIHSWYEKYIIPIAEKGKP